MTEMKKQNKSDSYNRSQNTIDKCLERNINVLECEVNKQIVGNGVWRTWVMKTRWLEIFMIMPSLDEIVS